LPVNPTSPETSQSPAVNEIEVIFDVVALVKETALADATVEDIYSPTRPAAAASFVFVPVKAVPPVRFIAVTAVMLVMSELAPAKDKVPVVVGSVRVPVFVIDDITGLVSVKPATVVVVLPR